MHTRNDAKWMDRALTLAMAGRGRVEPNPCVGCIIVRDGQVIGEGFNERYGGPHAEPNALANTDDASGATAYVTLEPCCHSGGGKQTPPCAPRLIEAKVARVVIGCLDPNPRVAGGGARQLREAGIEVVVGVREAQSRQLIAPFVARMEQSRPYVTLKWAVSRDGRVAGRQGRPVQISNAAASAAVHGLRGRCDAIGVGTNTLVNDDPLLTARTDNPPRTPIRVVFSNSLDVPHDRRLFQTPEAGPVWIFTSQTAATKPGPPNAEIIALPEYPNGRGGGGVRFSMEDVYAELGRRDMTHLLIEPGPKLARELITRDQADRVWLIHGQQTIGEDGLEAPECPWPTTGEVDLAGDRLVEHLNPESPVFARLTPSADLVLAGAV